MCKDMLLLRVLHGALNSYVYNLFLTKLNPSKCACNDSCSEKANETERPKPENKEVSDTENISPAGV